MAENDTGFIRRLARRLGGGVGTERNLYQQFGYPEILVPTDYQGMYYRNPIASRIIRAFPQMTWKDNPIFREGEKSATGEEVKDDSKFTQAWNDICEEKKITYYLQRADRLASIGEYGLLFLGFQDGLAPSLPLISKKADLIFMRPVSQTSVSVSIFDTDPASKRYGMPVLYNITPRTGRSGAPVMSVAVHYTRVLHISEFLEDDEVYGTPRLQPVYNALLDLEKVLGGGAETFWLNARNTIVGKVDPEADINDTGAAKVKEQMDDFVHQIRSYLLSSGIEYSQLNGTVFDPTGNITNLLSIIAGSVGLPQRILVGSERGELASSQDENNLAQRINERRSGFVSPMILRPLAEILIATGNLPEPSGEWWVEWPTETTDPEKLATIAVNKTQAVKNYLTTPGSDLVVTVPEFRTWVGLDPDAEITPDELEPLPEPEEPGADDYGDDDSEPPADEKPVDKPSTNEMLKVAADVGTGLITREAGISILVIGLGLTEGEADKIVGDDNSHKLLENLAMKDDLLKQIEDAL